MGKFNHSLLKSFVVFTILLFAGLAFVWPIPARADRGGMDFRGKWWRNPHIAQKLEISDHEKTKLDDMYLDFRIESVDLRATKVKNRFMLDHLLEKSKLDEQATQEQIDKVVESGSAIDRLRYGFVLAVRKLLGANRYSAFKATFEQKNRPPGKPGMSGPELGEAETKPPGKK